MAEQKTRENDQSVEQFLNGVADEKKRQDCFVSCAGLPSRGRKTGTMCK